MGEIPAENQRLRGWKAGAGRGGEGSLRPRPKAVITTYLTFPPGGLGTWHLPYTPPKPQGDCFWEGGYPVAELHPGGLWMQHEYSQGPTVMYVLPF